MIHVPLKTTKPLKLRQQLEKHLTQKYGKVSKLDRETGSFSSSGQRDTVYNTVFLFAILFFYTAG